MHRSLSLGFKLSDKPEGWAYRPQDLAQNLAAIVDALKLNGMTLVVQDWGGPISLSYAIHHPDTIRRIVIMNTWLWPVDRDPHDWRLSSLF